MLEAITDFWKPVKKTAQAAKYKLTDMQIGSVVTFGYVPQVALSGRKLTVTAINSYQFGQDVLTSFVLTNEKDTDISMIVAEAQGEQYLAISRRISEADRTRLFDTDSIKEITSDNEASTFRCRDNVPELKGWLVANYKREIQGMKGFIHRADFRYSNIGGQKGAEFGYTLLGSNSNEHAIEIESYNDGHIDIYATVYRRTSDVTDVTNPNQQAGAKPVLSVATESPKEVPKAETPKPEEKVEAPAKEPVKLEEVALPQMVATPLAEEVKKPEEPAPQIKLEVKPEVKTEAPKVEAAKIEEPKVEAPKPEIKPEITKPELIKKDAEPIKNEEKKDMSMAATMGSETKMSGTNGSAGAETPSVSGFGIKDYKQEIKAVNKIANGMDNESVECDLRVANQLIDEAIRNEMRLSDVVRRIIELPVAHQEAVHIPINLADEDYSLLAIRYGIPSHDRNAIKQRIIQDLGDFSGNKKKAS